MPESDGTFELVGTEVERLKAEFLSSQQDTSPRHVAFKKFALKNTTLPNKLRGVLWQICRYTDVF